ncbi:MAG TPA: TIGR04255 family protein [Planctomycetes bacterium]|nr:TIGR04255 family protein [Planctomycetota bacterium]
MADEAAERIPKRLEREPLIEALWEVRFALDEGVTGEVLAGSLYRVLKQSCPRIVRLPAADIPHPIAKTDIRLRYVPAIRLEGSQQAAVAVQVGNRLVSLNNRRPYHGWAEFSQRVRQLVATLRDTGLVKRVERFSLRYIDLLELEPPPSLGSLRVRLELAGRDLTRLPIHFRTEISDAPFLQIVQASSPAEVTLRDEGRRHGTILDIDTIRPVEASDDGWKALEAELDEAHRRSHRLFFSLLTADALEQLEPVYEQ